METKEFIKNHIQADERTRISRKLQTFSKKYREFSRYLDLIQKEEIGILFFNFKTTKYVHYTQVSKDIKDYTYKRIVKQLEVENFIEEASEDLTKKWTKDLEYNFKPKVYKLTQKGKDFLSIDFIKEYLEEEFEE